MNSFQTLKKNCFISLKLSVTRIGQWQVIKTGYPGNEVAHRGGQGQDEEWGVEHGGVGWMGAGETQGNRVSVNLGGSKMGTELEFRAGSPS